MSTRTFKKLFGDNSELEPVQSDDENVVASGSAKHAVGNVFNLVCIHKFIT